MSGISRACVPAKLLFTTCRDARISQGELAEEIIDEGVKDKRAMFHESELAQIFHVSNQTGSIMADVLRNAFDSRKVLANTVSIP